MTSQPDQAFSTTTGSTGHRDVHAHRPTHVNSAPSGPRSQPQPNNGRDGSNSDLSQGSRVLPSGPSATSGPRVRSSRDTPFNPNESSALRDRDLVDVDNLPPSRASFRTNDTSIRAGSGMYADREQSTDVPRGPRAMSSKPSTAPYPPLPPSPSASPSTFFAQRPLPSHDRPANRFRERSPPSNNEGWERRRDPLERQLRSDGPIMRDDTQAWRSGNVSGDDFGGRHAVGQDVEGNQVNLLPFSLLHND